MVSLTSSITASRLKHNTSPTLPTSRSSPRPFSEKAQGSDQRPSISFLRADEPKEQPCQTTQSSSQKIMKKSVIGLVIVCFILSELVSPTNQAQVRKVQQG